MSSLINSPVSFNLLIILIVISSGEIMIREFKYSVFVETFGDSPPVKVLDFFLTYQSFDYSKTQVAKETGISRMTIEKIWERLIKNKFIIPTRKIGRAEMYRLNKSNPRIKTLIELDFKISSAVAHEELQKIPVAVRHKA